MNRILKRFFFACFISFFIAGSCVALIYGHHYTDNLIAIVLLALIFSAILSLLAQYFYIDPVYKLIKMTNRIAQADFSDRVRLFRSDALGDLAHNLNDMSGQLKERMDRIVRDKKEMEAVLSSMIDGVAVIGRHEKILHMSPSSKVLLDLRSENTVGKRYWEVIRYDEINMLIKKAIQEGKPITEDVLFLNPEEKYLNVVISPVINEEAELTSVVAVFHDVSELKRFEKMRSDFVANVSHELKTPLTSIKGFVETLKDGAISTDKANHFLGIIQDQAGRLENLVSDLLSLSSLESQGANLVKTKENLADIMQRALVLLKNERDGCGEMIYCDCASNLPLVEVDRASVEQVFLNLLSNAIKFTPRDGGRIDVTIKPEKGWVRVDVKDNGIGIEKRHLERLFERFYRVDKARSRDLGGTGLGLSIVKHIMQAHQGKVAVVSSLESGSTFSVFFPLSCND